MFSAGYEKLLYRLFRKRETVEKQVCGLPLRVGIYFRVMTDAAVGAEETEHG